MMKASVYRRGIGMCVLIALWMMNPGGTLWAQLGAASLSGPGVAVSIDYLPASRYIRPEDSVKTKSTTSQLRYNFAAALVLSNQSDTVTGRLRSWNLITSGSYTKFKHADYDYSVFPEELLGAQVMLQHTRSIGKRWSMAAMLSFGLYTDLVKVNGEDIFINGGILFVRQHNSRFSYGIGAVLTNTFGTPIALPAFLLRWQTGGRYRFELDFPEKISASVRLNKWTDLALAVRPRGALYDVEKHSGNERLLGYMEISAGLESTWHLAKQFDFVVTGGSILTSGISFREKKLAEIFKEKSIHGLSTNYFFSAGFRWNFKKG